MSVMYHVLRQANLAGYLAFSFVVLTLLGAGHGSPACLDICLGWGALLFYSDLDNLVDPVLFFLVAAANFEVLFILCRRLSRRTYIWLPVCHFSGAALAFVVDPSRTNLSSAGTVALTVTVSSACVFTGVFFWIDRRLWRAQDRRGQAVKSDRVAR